ncbi:hypothetical protein HOLleu_20010 [Holothuria leucospilota]|uniref:Aminotransferase class I/classII large domain-containing protein n=1 Tax=Holothuria leucospilota TaxID=206669 RepID=A0A9Q1C0W6_HOLLE|nr:hypothetical protein HOLleu_20010 [Holothuria leucospilota]
MSTNMENQSVEGKDKNPQSHGDDFLLPHLRRYHGASNLAFNELVKKKRELGDHIYHLAFGQSPFPVMKEAQEALARNAGQAAYLDVAGLPKLREAICRFHDKYDNLSHFAAGDVVVGPGSKELIFLLMSVFSGGKCYHFVEIKKNCQIESLMMINVEKETQI